MSERERAITDPEKLFLAVEDELESRPSNPRQEMAILRRLEEKHSLAANMRKGHITPVEVGSELDQWSEITRADLIEKAEQYRDFLIADYYQVEARKVGRAYNLLKAVDAKNVGKRFDGEVWTDTYLVLNHTVPYVANYYTSPVDFGDEGVNGFYDPKRLSELHPDIRADVEEYHEPVERYRGYLLMTLDGPRVLGIKESIKCGETGGREEALTQRVVDLVDAQLRGEKKLFTVGISPVHGDLSEDDLPPARLEPEVLLYGIPGQPEMIPIKDLACDAKKPSIAKTQMVVHRGFLLKPTRAQVEQFLAADDSEVVITNESLADGIAENWETWEDLV